MSSSLKLGKKPPRLDARTLKLARYLTPQLPAPPAQVDYANKVQSWPMYLNDQLGCCVIAAAAHLIEEWTACADKPMLLSDADVLLGYEAVGGYVPGNPSTDNGCDMLTALNYWRRTGFGGHHIAAFASVNLLDQKEVEQAVYLFGGIFLGLALPLSAQSLQGGVWSVPPGGPVGDGAPGSWGGHAVPIGQYDPASQSQSALLTVVTWGRTLGMTWDFLKIYGDEAYVGIAHDWINGTTGAAVNGFRLQQLKADLAAL